MNREIKVLETLHYLEVLQANYHFMQPEMRNAIDHSITILSNIQGLIDALSEVSEQ